MVSYFFWDIENVSFHNLGKIMDHVRTAEGELNLFVIYSKIKEERKLRLIECGWIPVKTESISKNSADNKIKEMIDSLLEDNTIVIEKIFLITEDKGFFKISGRIKDKGIKLEIITATKNPQWIKNLNL